MSLTFDSLRAHNFKRQELFNCADWTPADWMTATVGELGELANVMKKLRRKSIVKRGVMNRATTVDIARLQKQTAEEIGDVQAYLDLLAMSLGVNLGEATRTKFNKVSKRVGFVGKL